MTARALKADPPSPDLREATDAERASIDRARATNAKRDTDRANAPKLKHVEGKTQGSIAVSHPHPDAKGWKEAFLNVLGTNSDAFGDMLSAQLAACKATSATDGRVGLEQGLAFMAGVQPTDELQAALGAQMFATHCASMELSRRMMASETIQQMEAYGTLATKLARTFTAQAEALAKLRSGGKQQVEVRYVYVDARGSQNVIGDLTGGGGGAGSERQPHAPLALTGVAPPLGLPMPSEDALGLPLPVACCEWSEALPDARRPKPWSATRGGERKLPIRGAHARNDRGAKAG